MENKKIIMILVLIAIILATMVGVMLFIENAKEPSKIQITNNKTIHKGDSLSLQLTDLNKTAISNQKVKITVTNKNNKSVVNKTVKTNSKGKAKLKLNLKKGKYNVTVKYRGNDNYTGNKTKQQLTIKENVKATTTNTESSLKYSINNLPPSNDPYPETRRYQVNEYTVVQEYEDGYRSNVDLRTGERSGGWI